MFRTKTPKALALGAAALCVGMLSVPANAASVLAGASIVDLTDTAGLLSFLGDSYFVSATTPLHDGFDVGTAPNDYLFNDGSSYASASAHGDLGFAETHAGATLKGLGAATVQWSMDWVANAAGTVQLSLEYLSSVTLLNFAPGDNAGVSALVNMLVDGTQLKAETLSFFTNANGNDFADDFLSLAFPVLAGQHGSLTVTVASNAYASPVPLPAGIWLLGSALAGLVGVVRRRASGELVPV